MKNMPRRADGCDVLLHGGRVPSRRCERRMDRAPSGSPVQRAVPMPPAGRLAIQFLTSEANHATRRLPSRRCVGNAPTAI